MKCCFRRNRLGKKKNLGNHSLITFKEIWGGGSEITDKASILSSSKKFKEAQK